MSDDAVKQARAALRRPGNIHGLFPSLAERGRIKIGGRGKKNVSAGGKEWYQPEKYSHFVITTLERDPQSGTNFKIDKAIHTMLGTDKPTTIPIRLLYNDIDLNVQSRYMAKATGRMAWYCTGNGEVALRAANADGSGNVHSRPCPCELLDQGKCKINAVLTVVIDGTAGLGGVWKFRTSSKNSTEAILASLVYIKSLTRGILAGIPLDLVLRPKTVITPEGATSTIYVVAIEYRGTINQLQESTLKLIEQNRSFYGHLKEEEDVGRVAQTSNMGEAGDEDEETITEFYPDEQPQGSADNQQSAAPVTQSTEAKPDATASNDPPPAPETKAKPRIDIDKIM